MRRTEHNCKAGSRSARLGLACAMALLAGGCQAYEARPLDMAGHASAFTKRGADGEEVRRFARLLAASEAAEGTGEFDASDGITWAEGEVLALVFNADLRLARMRAGVTRATAESAGLWEDPTLGVDLTRIVESTPEPWKVMTSVGITVPISGRLEVEKQRASAEHVAELARVAEREWATRMAVRRAWTEWTLVQTRLDVTREFVQRVDEVLVVVSKMEQAGELSRTEARLFRIERANANAALALLESRAREAELHARQLMGMAPDAPLRLVPRSVGFARSGAAGDGAERARRNPGVVAAELAYAAAERALELQVRKQYPDLHIGPGFGRDEGQDEVMFGLSLPIPVLNANRQGIAEATAQREVARVAAEAVLEQAIASMHAASSRLAAATERRRVLENELVPLVDAQYADAREVARLGEVNSLVLLESLTRQHDAKVALVEAVRDEAMSEIDVAEIAGPEAKRAEPEERDAKSEVTTEANHLNNQTASRSDAERVRP